jgi:hypothetical protein
VDPLCPGRSVSIEKWASGDASARLAARCARELENIADLLRHELGDQDSAG